MKVIKYIPSFFYLLVVYNIIAFSGSEAEQNIFTLPLFTIPLISGAVFQATISDILVMIGLIALYIEIFKATKTSVSSVIDHALSMIVFIIFLIEFIVVEQVGNSSFLILTLMALLDVIAGFTVTISAARRDISMGG